MKEYTPEQFKAKYGLSAATFKIGQFLTPKKELEIVKAGGDIVTTKEYGKDGQGFWTIYFSLDVAWWTELNADQSIKMAGSILKIYIFDNEEEQKVKFVTESNYSN